MVGLEHYQTAVVKPFATGAIPRMMRDPAKAMGLKNVKPGQGL